LTADREELKVALKNLLENAIRYTGPGGKISIQAAQRNGAVEIAVADTGIGIPSQELGRIFERFYRVDKSRAREEGGTGLGLSIVKHIAEAHRGRVEVQSEVGKGSKFTLIIPV
jgi:two-component system phosphate regulon sensor histidine kinase PhoR